MKSNNGIYHYNSTIAMVSSSNAAIISPVLIQFNVRFFGITIQQVAQG